MKPVLACVLAVVALAGSGGCGSDQSGSTPDGATSDLAFRPGDANASADDLSGGVDGAGASTDLATDDAGESSPNDAGDDDSAMMMSCGGLGQMCVNGAGCCSGSCDPNSKTCIAPPNVCGQQGAPCALITDCCSLNCSGGKCSTQCKPNGTQCAAHSDCCTVNCSGGTCQPIVPKGCVTLGNKCGANADCCSNNCQGGLCFSQGGGCAAIGDICLRNIDCCSNLCTIPQGMMAGTCTDVNGGGAGNCKLDGEPCAGCSTCCSHVCAPTLVGGQVCVAAAGCRVAGDTCFKDSDCCGGAKNGLPGDGSVMCNLIQGTNPLIGTCSNPNGCDPDGDVCGLSMNNTCGNARHDCCDCLPPKINCCKFDKAGVPRCYGGSTQQCPNGYTGKAPCCIAPGNVCAFSSECCNGAPCVPDMKGVLRCGKDCQPIGQVCTADSDCCIGLTCRIPKGQLVGTCEGPPVPPDMAMPLPPDMVSPPDFTGQKVDFALPAPDLSMPKPCSQLGQACSTMQPCCNGLICAPPGGIGVCKPGEMDCTCVGVIG